MAIPPQGQYRNPHEQRFKGGGGSVVGKRVKANVYAVVEEKMRFSGDHPGHQGDPFRGDAVLREQIKITLSGRLVRRLTAFEKQA